MLGEFIYSLLYALYSVVLVVWYSIYDEISFIIEANMKRNCICSFFKKFVKLRVFLVMVVQLGISYVKGIRKNKEYRELSYIALGILYVNFM